MTAYHAIHPEDIAPDCPQCADPLTVEGDEPAAQRRRSGLLAALCLLLALALVAVPLLLAVRRG